jgi:hypothetical protein
LLEGWKEREGRYAAVGGDFEGAVRRDKVLCVLDYDGGGAVRQWFGEKASVDEVGGAAA